MKEEYILAWGDHLDDVIKELLKAKNEGRHAFAEFSGHILDSDTITWDSAYELITGLTRDEYITKEKQSKFEKEIIENVEKQLAYYERPNWIERGKALIYPENYESWESVVNHSAKGMFHGKDISKALDIMEALKEGKPIEEVLKEFKSIEDEPYSLRTEIDQEVFKYSKRGPEYMEAKLGKDINARQMEDIEDQEFLNRQHESKQLTKRI